ncbi:MAG: DNA-binding protein [Candidatus Tenebribacter davisii]|nr:DNA-binding protein [Candidatus Tenebribacter davisii]
MKSKKIDNKFFIRIDPEEEIVSKLTEFCKNNSIKFGNISGIGAVNKVEIGLYDTLQKKYYSDEMSGAFEILSINGNITSLNEQPYLHIHITFADSKHNAFGGHLNMAIVSATCEVIIEEFEGEIARSFDEEIGLNLLKI